MRAPSRLARALTGASLAAVLVSGCEAAPRAAPLVAQEPIAQARFAALVDRISEPGGYFDTDNLISNETGYLKVMDALAARGSRGGAYVGVGPDQNYSYIAQLEPEIAFIADVRRDNLLHHLLLKALVERAATRVGFLTGLHGVEAPTDPDAWRERDIDEIVAYVDGAPRLASLEPLQSELAAAIDGYGIALTAEDHETVRRFHQAFVDAGLSLRFTSYGRPPRPYYPTYRQLVSETDIDGDQVSWLSTAERYGVVRRLHRQNRILPIVADLSGGEAMPELGRVMRELEVELTAVYASNVEYYLWQARTFDRWVDNLGGLPGAPDAVVIRSYFPSFGRAHSSAVVGYHAVQLLQEASTLLSGDFRSYWEVVTVGALELR